MAIHDYDLFVIGGGSGGVRAARLAAGLGKRVAIAEADRLGGTCVIRGCVPKKLFVYASRFAEEFGDAAGFGWRVGETRFDWPTLVRNKDREIARLEALYRKGLEDAGVSVIDGRAELVDERRVRIERAGRTVTAERILIAVGARPRGLDGLEGHELTITSNEAFDLERLPKAILIAGGGYVAVEFANLFHGLGVETTLVHRGPEILRNFDTDLRGALQQAMGDRGVRMLCGETVAAVRRGGDGRLAVTTSAGRVLAVDEAMLAVGRAPNTAGLGLDRAGVAVDGRGAVIVDDFQRTSAGHIYAVGDATDRVQLTPVAIHEAMCVVETAFRDNPTAADHALVPTAVFSRPEIGTVGLSEDRAAREYGEIEVYRAVFTPMKLALTDREEKMVVKLVVDAADRRVLGAHILGPDAAELAQALAVALKAGCGKDDFDRTMAVHPTAAEELVTMYRPSYRVRDGRRIA